MERTFLIGCWLYISDLGLCFPSVILPVSALRTCHFPPHILYFIRSLFLFPCKQIYKFNTHCWSSLITCVPILSSCWINCIFHCHIWVFPLFSLNELFLERNLSYGQLLSSFSSVCENKSWPYTMKSYGKTWV